MFLVESGRAAALFQVSQALPPSHPSEPPKAAAAPAGGLCTACSGPFQVHNWLAVRECHPTIQTGWLLCRPLDRMLDGYLCGNSERCTFGWE